MRQFAATHESTATRPQTAKTAGLNWGTALHRGSVHTPTMSALPSATERLQVLVVCARTRMCAIRISHVGETMRPLPIAALVGAPPYVLGLAMIRAVATPVVDLGAVLEETSPACLTRFLTLNVATRRIALAVDRVVGVQFLTAAALRPLPAQLHSGAGQRIEAVGSLDEQLLFLIEPAHLVPEPLWATLSLEAA